MTDGSICFDSSISIHALLAESDHPKMSDHPHNINFYPRSPCGERLRVLDGSKSSIEISIHALLAESDVSPAAIVPETLSISIHALLAESDYGAPCSPNLTYQFLSTLSLRRATQNW